MLTLIMFAVSLSGVVSLTVDDLYPYPYDNVTTTDDQLLRRNDDGSSSAIPISFPYFNNVQTSAYVNTNGDITFGTLLGDYTPDAFPNGSYVMIAAFWTDIDTTHVGQIWYKRNNSSDLLTRAASDVQSAFSDQKHFNPSMVFIVTWHKVPYYGASGKYSQLRNTFQIVLTTDGTKSFVMFHYLRLDWSRNVMVGFNAGDGLNSYTVNGSLSDDVVNLVHRSNVGVPGTFVFRVDGVVIQPADQDYTSSKTDTDQ
ncbi:sushi, nidogen and EGF-like domain-containing protein 1 isoform X2 [Mizuhopecten yessoensis]|uniref:sushi, nidogen and EGF-like domain-containing protein 1 isoform X2 n=1 Tax=Mizuhopecten yessoensis TaxID=6573 RepID=UPI000B45C33B|nr:sushi, nidogen and EGF-like domain-containing protein 1 isoform X2 [Mizuhopecten yessoensis]